jgi:hypothetical protein
MGDDLVSLLQKGFVATPTSTAEPSTCGSRAISTGVWSHHQCERPVQINNTIGGYFKCASVNGFSLAAALMWPLVLIGFTLAVGVSQPLVLSRLTLTVTLSEPPV